MNYQELAVRTRLSTPEEAQTQIEVQSTETTQTPTQETLVTPVEQVVETPTETPILGVNYTPAELSPIQEQTNLSLTPLWIVLLLVVSCYAYILHRKLNSIENG